MFEQFCNETGCERLANDKTGFCSQHRKQEKEPDGIQEIQRDEKTGLQGKIVRNLGDFTVALLAISDNPERLERAGTGTSVAFDGA